MKKEGTVKKLFLYISLSVILCYFVFAILMYTNNSFKEIYTLSDCSLYYIIVYALLTAVSYYIDTLSKKEPGLLTLIALPIYSFLFLFAMMLIASCEWFYVLISFVILAAVLVAGFIVYKKVIMKILLKKNAYENVLLAYTILHVFMVLLSVFIMINLL